MIPSTVSASPRGIAVVGGALASVLAAGLASGCLTAGMGAGGASLWWSWTAPASGMVTIDTLLAVYTEGSVDALTVVASNDDATGLQSEVSFTAQQGVVYHIAVDGCNVRRVPSYLL